MPLKKYMHIAIWIIYFSSGIFQILNFYPAQINTLALALILVLLVFTVAKGSVEKPYSWIIILLGIISVVSGQMLNNINILYTIVFYRQLVLLPYLYFIIIINEKDMLILRTIEKTIVILFVIQIPAMFVKYILVGAIENYVGTMSVAAGSLSAVLPMVAVSYLFSKYLYMKNKRILLYILLFVVFGLIGGKRVLWFSIPCLIFAISLIHSVLNKKNIIRIIRTGGTGLFLIVITLYLSLRFTPTLNPENKMGGSFDIDYAVKFTEEYTLAKKSTRMTRTEGAAYFFNLIASKNLKTILLGGQAGKLIPSSINSEDPIKFYYGINYGGRMGIVWIFLQIGLIGSLLFLLIFMKMFVFVIRNFSSYHHLAFIGIWLSIILDLLFYSMTSILFFPIMGVFFCYFGLIYKEVKLKQGYLGNNSLL